MDIAYDHIQEEVLSPEAPDAKEKDGVEQPSLNTEFAQAYQAISSTSWGARFGALVGTVKKQGETYYEGARQEYSAATSQATKGLSEIINRTRSMSLKQPLKADSASKAADSDKVGQGTSEPAENITTIASPSSEHAAGSSTEGMLSRFRSEAFKRLKDIEKAEEAADEALLKFGTNIRNFLREAVTIAPPADGKGEAPGDGKTTLLYESKDHEGKRVIHTTRFDAQLHAIHSSVDSFIRDPISPEYQNWNETFEVEKKTEEISSDLEKHKELRSMMEKVVPEKVKYEDFWKRYYFLRHVIETEEQKRKEMLNSASAQPAEEVAWDDDSDAEAPAETAGSGVKVGTSASVESSSTLHPSPAKPAAASPSIEAPSDLSLPQQQTDAGHLNDQQSHADSDASYDVVSGAPSGSPTHAPGSPKESKKAAAGEESDEEDWE